MKLHLELDTEAPGDLSAAYKVLNALKGAAQAGPAAPAPNAAPAPAAPPAHTPPAAPAPTAPVPPASAPVAASPAPAPAAPPPPAAGGISAADFGAQVQAFAKAYSPKACKARFGELSQAFGTNWTKTSDIPPEKYADVMPWFAVAA